MTSLQVRRGDRFESLPGVLLLTFPGGEPHVNVDQPGVVAGRHLLIDSRIGSFNDFGTMLVAADAMERLGAASVSLFCPYLPGARQDRGAPLTAAVYARLLNSAGFAHVVAVDPHSWVMPALVERLTIVPAEAVVPVELLGGDDIVLVCPDAGATKRVEAVADRFGLPVLYGRKHRDPATGKLSGFSCDPVPDGATAVVIDDICDGGGTFLGLADALGLPRERLRLWTTHGIYSHGTDILRQRFGTIACTDSFPGAAEADLVVPLATAPAVTDTLLRLVPSCDLTTGNDHSGNVPTETKER